MFLLVEQLRSIVRNKGKSALLVCMAFLLMSGMGVYLGNIQENRNALQNLSETLPVKAKIVNRDGSQEVGLAITERTASVLLKAGIRNPVYTALMSGNIEKVNQASGGKVSDTAIAGTNTLEAFGENLRQSAVFADGWDESFAAGEEAVCMVDESYARRYQVNMGDTVQLPVYWLDYDQGGMSFQYQKLADVSLRVIGSYQMSGAQTTHMIVPIEWMKQVFQTQDVLFTFDSFHGIVADALRLNDFKAAAEAGGLLEAVDTATDLRTGNTLVVQDQLFIETAGRLQENIELYSAFQIPLFLLLVGMITIVTFLVCRSRQRELALASALGRSRFLSGLGCFLENVILYGIGLVLAGLFLAYGIGIGLAQTVQIALVFFLCADAGVLLSICLLYRFDAMSLLTKME